ncbi:YadA C-terminal domain-containing protein [Morganella morganii]|uniref:YadA C-terminal domain-containing protein n=2 Tax=Morganella morganii TaxID=582 RepID=UPI001BDB75B9|nr:YadA C-terminal domain-containing protein [Morganella morganii]MBT0394441.1 YadA-like family protein [Morganella morganii subsp. morganii]MBT0460837.1 YadA-like family protein [Morganella morganii subsp. morganii]
MFKKSCLFLALIPFISVAAPVDENDDADGEFIMSANYLSNKKIEQIDGVKLGSGFISTEANNTIIIGNTADKNEIPPENPNSKIPANQPKPPVAKSDSDIAIGNSAYADSSADGQAGAPSMAVGNAAVAKGEGSVALGSKAVSDGMGGVAIGDAAKQKNGGISIGSNSNAGTGGTILDPAGDPMAINHNVAIGTDARVVNGAKDSVALGANSVAGIESTQKVRFLAEDARAAQNVGDVSVGNKSSDLQNEPDTFRRVTNVAGGSEDTDAANIAQLNVVNNTATAAENTAKAADTKATDAKKAADAADGKATEAQKTAVTANTNAIDARNTAYTANTTAQKANNTANNAYNLATHNSARIDKLELRYDELNDKMQRGFAMSAATSNLFQPYNVGKFNLSAAVGGYNSENAVAVGSGYRFNENVAVKASLATSTSNGGDVMYGAGMNLEW